MKQNSHKALNCQLTVKYSHAENWGYSTDWQLLRVMLQLKHRTGEVSPQTDRKETETGEMWEMDEA